MKKWRYFDALVRARHTQLSQERLGEQLRRRATEDAKERKHG